MGEVAARAGASKATLYKSFADTETLFRAALAREVERRRGAIAGNLAEPDLAGALAAAGHAMQDALDDRALELFRLVIAEAGRHPAIGRAFYEELVEAAARPIAGRRERDLGRDAPAARVLALQFVGAIKEPLFYPRLMGMTIRAEPAPAIERAVRMVLAADGPVGASAARDRRGAP